MSGGREEIALALFAKLSAVPGFVTVSRKMKHWSDTPASEQPSLFVRQTGQVYEQNLGLPPRLILNFEVAVYAQSSDPGDIPTSIQNALLDDVAAALAPDDFGTKALTLGGLCKHCWIDGNIETDEGLLGQQTVALIPIKVLTNL